MQLLDAVSRMASLGFEKSYRETVVLMTRSYLNKLSSVGLAENKTEAPEATTEHVEVHGIPKISILHVNNELLGAIPCKMDAH